MSEIRLHWNEPAPGGLVDSWVDELVLTCTKCGTECGPYTEWRWCEAGGLCEPNDA